MFPNLKNITLKTTLTGGGRRDLPLFQKVIDEREANIMPIAFILTSRIAQSNDQNAVISRDQPLPGAVSMRRIPVSFYHNALSQTITCQNPLEVGIREPVGEHSDSHWRSIIL